MKKTIFFLVNNLSFLVSHRFDIVIAAKKKGYNVKIGYGELGNTKTKIFLEKNIDLFLLPLKRNSINPLAELWTFIKICQIFRKLKPDIVHLITIKAYLYGGIAARIEKIPCVVSSIAGLGILFNQKKKLNFFFHKILYPLFNLAFNHPNQRVIVQNRKDRKILIDWIRFKKKKISLIKGSGVKLSKFHKLTERNNITTICFASRLLYQKGVYDFISAARIILKKGIKAKFLLAGSLDPGNFYSLTQLQLNNITKEKIVDVIGYQEDIPKLFSKSNIICLPSFYGEGLPKVLIEAAAASRAIVTTNISGCREAVIPNKTGLLVPIKNPQKLADALQWLIKHPNERIAMGKAGRKLAEKEFRIEKIVEDHLIIYKQLILSQS